MMYNNKIPEPYKFVANKIITFCDELNIKTIIFTSSVLEEEKISNTVKNIYNVVKSLNKKVGFITDFKKLNLDNEFEVSFSGNKIKLEEIISNKFKDYDIVLVSLSNILKTSDNFECVKHYKKVILLEKYMYTKYHNYKNMLLELSQAKVDVLGVVTVK